MDRLLVACALATVVGLVLLGGLAHLREPRPEPFERLPNLVGQRVCVDAVLAHVRPVDAGAHLLLVQGGRSLAAFSRFEPDALTGDRVLACGSLDGGSGSLRLRLERADDLSVLVPFDAEATPLSAVADRPWAYVDRHVAVHGVAEREGGRTWLVDATTGARLPLSGAPWTEARVHIRVVALVAFDEETAAFRLVALETRPA